MACDSRYHIMKSGLLGGKPKKVEEEEPKEVPKKEVTKVEDVKKVERPTRRSYFKRRK